MKTLTFSSEWHEFIVPLALKEAIDRADNMQTKLYLQRELEKIEKTRKFHVDNWLNLIEKGKRPKRRDEFTVKLEFDDMMIQEFTPRMKHWIAENEYAVARLRAEYTQFIEDYKDARESLLTDPEDLEEYRRFIGVRREEMASWCDEIHNGEYRVFHHKKFYYELIGEGVTYVDVTLSPGSAMLESWIRKDEQFSI